MEVVQPRGTPCPPPLHSPAPYPTEDPLPPPRPPGWVICQSCGGRVKPQKGVKEYFSSLGVVEFCNSVREKMGSGGEMDGCAQFMKYSMFAANFIIFVGGLTVFGLGIWTVMDKSFLNELLGTNLFMGAVYIIIATGAIVTLVAFFGCLGAIKEIKCMLLSYALFLLMVLVVMLVGGILGYVFRDKVRHSMEQEMYSSIKFYGNRHVRRAWDDTQENLECCGVTSYTDWKGDIPDSCCRERFDQKINCRNFQTSLNIYDRGCLDVAEEYIKEHTHIIAAAAITVSCLMILGLIFSLAMFKMIE